MKLLRQSFSFLFLLAFLLCAPAPAQTNSRKPGGDIYSKKSVRAVMEKVFEWQAANPVGINTSNSNLWARAAFFTYALAWDINNRILDRKTYLPVVRKGWGGLLSHVREDGKLGRVQQIGLAPARVTAEDNQEYGSGALLLAGSEMLKLK